MTLWKDVKGYEGIYEVSDKGEVKSLNYKKSGVEKLLIPVSYKGYMGVVLCYDGRKKSAKVHRLVAIAFLDNPLVKPQVNHINGVKSDNRVENLEWCTSSENILHAFKTGLKKNTENHNFKTNHPTRGKKGYLSKISNTVEQFMKNGHFIKEWGGTRDAGRELGICQSDISKCCRGLKSQVGGFIWKYK